MHSQSPPSVGQRRKSAADARDHANHVVATREKTKKQTDPGFAEVDDDLHRRGYTHHRVCVPPSAFDTGGCTSPGGSSFLIQTISCLKLASLETHDGVPRLSRETSRVQLARPHMIDHLRRREIVHVRSPAARAQVEHSRFSSIYPPLREQVRPRNHRYLVEPPVNKANEWIGGPGPPQVVVCFVRVDQSMLQRHCVLIFVCVCLF